MASATAERAERLRGGSRRAALAAPAAATALAAALGFLLVGSKSFWLDEAFSAAAARLSLGGLWRLASDSQANMSLYYAVLHGWRAVGDSEAALRSLSVLFAAAAVPVVWAIARRLFDETTAAAAALLLAVNQFLVRYAQEARGYALAVLLVSVASLLFLRAAERPSAGRLAAYALVGAASLYVHFYAALVLLAHVAVAGVWPVARRRFAVAYAAIAVLGSPLALFVLFRDSGQIAFLGPPGPVELAKAFAHLGGGRAPVLAYAALGAAALVVARGEVLAPRSAAGRRWTFLLLWLFLPIVVSFAASQAKPFFQALYLIVCLPPVVIVVARGLVTLPRPRLRVAATAVVLALSAVELGLWYGTYDKEDWRGAERYVAANARPGDAVAFYAPYARIPFEYYVRRDGDLPAQPGYPAAPWGDLDLEHETFDDPALRFTPRLLARHRRVWVVLSHAGGAGERTVRAASAAAGRQVGARSFTDVDVLLFARRS
jgi:mannosyltransferase